jgi:non-ribosomal peptide synthetase component F
VLELVRRCRNAVVDAYDHQDMPLAKIIEVVRPAREQGRMPLFQVTAELQLERWLPLELPGATVDYGFVAPHHSSRYELSYHAVGYGDHLLLALEANTDLWRLETANRQLVELEELLRRMASNPSHPI